MELEWLICTKLVVYRSLIKREGGSDRYSTLKILHLVYFIPCFAVEEHMAAKYYFCELFIF